ncbi:hypothetical protein B0T26DRAFT_497805 [Lasiosphaeria miniovina]|uniref:Uncharacterized protein n=1 Tax=Lasiosphaeria miniovina TaxID=1954250 RepID=A0AA39ZTM0_9PEZI|nr:uncharacterized protein B0T26DRAFT_497805 [Lasiosphaeria miniovina]KAK0703423.1 hypothetical protein B0T26DRAFT_497805 [Lasiosphaeria miniovina]
MATTPQSNGNPLTRGTEWPPGVVEEAARRSPSRSPPRLPLRTDDLPFTADVAGDTSRRPERNSPVAQIPLSPGIRTQENNPTRYEPYLWTLSGRKPYITEKAKAAGGWKRLTSRQCPYGRIEEQGATFSPPQDERPDDREGKARDTWPSKLILRRNWRARDAHIGTFASIERGGTQGAR